MLESLPLFNYKQIKPKINYGLRTTQTRFYPIGKNNFTTGISPDSYVKFQIFSNGFWDPKSAYIHVEVAPKTFGPFIDATTTATTVWQIDNSAQSLFAQLIIRHNGKEIERILEYDSLSAMIYDMNIGITERDNIEVQGLGKNRTPSHPTQHSKTGMSLTTNYAYVAAGTKTEAFAWNQLTSATTYDPINIWYNFGNPTQLGMFPALTNTTFGPSSIMGGTTINLLSTSAGLTSSGWRPYLCTQPPLRNQDLYNMNVNLGGGNEPQQIAQISSVFEQFMFDDSEGAQLTFLGNVLKNNGMWLGFRSQYVKEMGFDKPFSDASIGGNEPWMTDGYLVKHSTIAGMSGLSRPNSLQFCVPLLSPIFGILSTHKKLLPLALFQGLEFEFLINKYAFHAHACPNKFIHGDNFTYNLGTGLWTSVHFFSEILANRSNWYITRMEMVVEIINMDDQIERNIIDNIINNGFSLPYETWYMCLKKKSPSNVECSTTLSINHAFESMKMVSLRACSTDYEQYSIFRKHHYLSLNLTSIQIKVGTEFIPSNAITGHCGFIRNESINTSVSSTLRGCYIDFYIQTMKAWGKFFNMKNSTLLNATNYTINQTPFNVPTSLSTSIALNAITNTDLGYGQTIFHNNRYIGRCIISIDTEKFDILPNYISGTDTTQYKPWDIIVTCDTSSVNLIPSYTHIVNSAVIDSISGPETLLLEPNAYFNRGIYIYIWVYYDARLVFTPVDGWTSLGRY